MDVLVPGRRERGLTVASYLSRSRDLAAAGIFFRRALKRHGQPRSITLDGASSRVTRHCALYHRLRDVLSGKFLIVTAK